MTYLTKYYCFAHPGLTLCGKPNEDAFTSVSAITVARHMRVPNLKSKLGNTAWEKNQNFCDYANQGLHMLEFFANGGFYSTIDTYWSECKWYAQVDFNPHTGWELHLAITGRCCREDAFAQRVWSCYVEYFGYTFDKSSDEEVSPAEFDKNRPLLMTNSDIVNLETFIRYRAERKPLGAVFESCETYRDAEAFLWCESNNSYYHNTYVTKCNDFLPLEK